MACMPNANQPRGKTRSSKCGTCDLHGNDEPSKCNWSPVKNAESIPRHGENRQPPNDTHGPENDKRQWNRSHAIDSHTPNGPRRVNATIPPDLIAAPVQHLVTIFRGPQESTRRATRPTVALRAVVRSCVAIMIHGGPAQGQ